MSPSQIAKLISPAGDSWASTAGARKSFHGNRSRDTGPELAIRRSLHGMGLRYRVGVRPDPKYRGTADIVFRKARVAVFVDGCYWHACPEHYKPPTAHAEYWTAKVVRNVSRDRKLDAHLKSRGWLSLRFWEHQAPEEVANRIREALAIRLLSGAP